MKWSTEPPKEPGWYFYQRTDGNYPVRFGYIKKQQYIQRWTMEIREDFAICKHLYDENGFFLFALTVPHRWAGPIPEPEKE